MSTHCLLRMPPGCRAAEDIVKFFLCELSPSASPSSELVSHSLEHHLDVLVVFPSITHLLIVDAPPERECLFSIGGLFISPKLLRECLVHSPEEVEPSFLALLHLCFLPHGLPLVKFFFPLCHFLDSFRHLFFCHRRFNLLSASFAKDLVNPPFDLIFSHFSSSDRLNQCFGFPCSYLRLFLLFIL